MNELQTAIVELIRAGGAAGIKLAYFYLILDFIRDVAYVSIVMGTMLYIGRLGHRYIQWQDRAQKGQSHVA